MKKIRLIPILIAAVFAVSCSNQSSGLGQFVGKWNTIYSLADSTGVRVSSGSLTVKQPSSDTVTFEESTSVVTGVGQFGVPMTSNKSFNVTLKQTNATSFLLSLKVDGNDIVSAFPLSFSEGQGFTGQGPATVGGKQEPVIASIKKEGQGHVWKISSDTAGTTKFDYEFTFKEKS